jgi:hypothetical protein
MTLKEKKKERAKLLKQTLEKLREELLSDYKQEVNAEHYTHLLTAYAEAYHKIKTFQ